MSATRLPFTTSAEIEAHCSALSAISIGPSGTAQELVDSAIESATELMWHLTGRQFGLWTETIRPYLNGEVVYRLEPGEYPITSVQAVKIDGTTLPTSGYWVSDDRFISLTSGDQWPATQLQYLSDSEAETFSITYTWGVAPPPAVRSGARRLACELIAMGSGTSSALSERIRSVSRQGTSFELVSPQDLLESNGRTGIYEVDLAISAYNSGGNVAPPIVMSPDSFMGDRAPTGSGAVQGAPGPAGPPGPAGAPGAGWSTVFEQVLSTSASSIPITGVEAADRWMVHIITRSTGTGATPTDLRLNFNADTGYNYEYVQMGASNSANTYTARNDVANNADHIRLGLVSQSTAGTQRFGHVTSETHYVSGLSSYIMVSGSSTAMHTSSNETYTTRMSGVWRNTNSPISVSPTLTLGSGQFAPGTVIQVSLFSG
jgi:hypothetical protein